LRIGNLREQGRVKQDRLADFQGGYPKAFRQLFVPVFGKAKHLKRSTGLRRFFNVLNAFDYKEIFSVLFIQKTFYKFKCLVLLTRYDLHRIPFAIFLFLKRERNIPSLCKINLRVYIKFIYQAFLAISTN
jgi:hypothetical protein